MEGRRRRRRRRTGWATAKQKNAVVQYDEHVRYVGADMRHSR